MLEEFRDEEVAEVQPVEDQASEEVLQTTVSVQDASSGGCGGEEAVRGGSGIHPGEIAAVVKKTETPPVDQLEVEQVDMFYESASVVRVETSGDAEVQPVVEQVVCSGEEVSSGGLSVQPVRVESGAVEKVRVPVRYGRKELLVIQDQCAKGYHLRGSTQRKVTSAVQRSGGTHQFQFRGSGRLHSGGMQRYRQQVMRPWRMKVQVFQEAGGAVQCSGDFFSERELCWKFRKKNMFWPSAAAPRSGAAALESGAAAPGFGRRSAQYIGSRVLGRALQRPVLGAAAPGPRELRS